MLSAGKPDAPEGMAALERLCRAYWYPVYASVRRHGHDPTEATDSTQEFFLRLLERGDLARVRPERGRFRWYLSSALRHFLANEWRKLQTQKRGAGKVFVTIDSLSAERRYDLQETHELPPDKLYDRSWALTVLEEARERLRAEFIACGKGERFQWLEPFLPGEESDLTYAEAGRKMGLSESAVKSEVHRLKKRYRSLVRTSVAHTVASPEEIDDEIRYLAGLLAE